jgi:transposase
MGAAVALRADYGADDLRALAKASRDARQTRRLLALAAIYDGGARSEAARIGGVGLQIVRDWVVRFNAEGPEGLVDRAAPGKAPLLTAAQRVALARAVEEGPKPYLDGVVRWRLVDLVQWLWEEFGVSVSRQTLGRELRALGFRKLSARPRHHGQDPDALEAFKKTSPSGWRRSGRASRPGPSSSSGGRTRRA